MYKSIPYLILGIGCCIIVLPIERIFIISKKGRIISELLVLALPTSSPLSILQGTDSSNLSIILSVRWKHEFLFFFLKLFQMLFLPSFLSILHQFIFVAILDNFFGSARSIRNLKHGLKFVFEFENLKLGDEFCFKTGFLYPPFLCFSEFYMLMFVSIKFYVGKFNCDF